MQRYRRIDVTYEAVISRYKRIQLYRTALQGVSGPIRIKLNKLVPGHTVYF